MMVVWALGAYPVEREDYNIEMTFKIIPGVYEGNKRAKVEESNKYLLKVSLVGILQEALNVIKDNAIVQVLVSDYVGQERLSRMSFIYMLVILIALICSLLVRRIFCGSSSKNSIQSKLLVTHNNFVEYLKVVSKNRGIPPTVKSDSVNKFESDSLNDSHSSKQVEVSVVSNSHVSRFELSSSNSLHLFKCDHSEDSELFIGVQLSPLQNEIQDRDPEAGPGPATQVYREVKIAPENHFRSIYKIEDGIIKKKPSSKAIEFLERRPDPNRQYQNLNSMTVWEGI
ncbi:8830_t:CDS:2, partial [Dentiscutata erythropus]